MHALAVIGGSLWLLGMGVLFLGLLSDWDWREAIAVIGVSLAVGLALAATTAALLLLTWGLS